MCLQEKDRLNQILESKVEQLLSREIGVGEQPSGPMKLTWRRGEPAPKNMALPFGSAVVHESTAYFSSGYHVYSFIHST